MDRVLVTGGAGYIGSILVRHLLELGYHVKVIDNFLFGNESLKSISNNPNLSLFNIDIRNSDILKSIIEASDAIVHMAAIVGDPACSVQADVAVETNFLATIKLARLCREFNTKHFIFLSTCSVYGSNKHDPDNF